MAVNVFSNPINGPASITNRGVLTGNVVLGVNDTAIQRMSVGATDRQIQLPNPALCLNRIIEISNISTTNNLAVYQYNATDFAGAVIPLPGIVGGTLKAATSVIAGPAPQYTSARYWCDGTTGGTGWNLLSATPNPVFA